MRIMVHPLYTFELFTQNVKIVEFMLARFDEVVKDSIVLHMPIRCHDYLAPELLRLYNKYEKEYKKKALLHIDYPTEDLWNYNPVMDEKVLELAKNESIVFCGGYVENCLARAYGAFQRDYGTFCEENGNVLRLDDKRSYCASNTVLQHEIFLDTRTGHDKDYSLQEFDWWARSARTNKPIKKRA